MGAQSHRLKDDRALNSIQRTRRRSRDSEANPLCSFGAVHSDGRPDGLVAGRVHGRGSSGVREQQVTISGTPGDDRLRGDAGTDVIDGRGGDDRISGLDGIDVICGGGGTTCGREGGDAITAEAATIDPRGEGRRQHRRHAQFDPRRLLLSRGRRRRRPALRWPRWRRSPGGDRATTSSREGRARAA